MQKQSYSYIGRHAELYDLFYAEKPYRDETLFIDYCLQKYGNNVRYILELGCGTGTHAFLLEEMGYKITATDLSPDMLAQAEIKGKVRYSKVKFRLQDMRRMKTSKRPFDAVICLFDSLGYVNTNEALLEVLGGVRRQLSSSGIFLFEFWHAGAMLKNFDPIRIRRYQTSYGEIERISETSMNCKEQLCHVNYTINEFNNDGTFRQTLETQTNRFFLVQEMALFLQQSGLHPLSWFAGYHEGGQIDQNTWHIVAVAKKD